MNLQKLLTKLDTPIVIRPTWRMTQGELETYLDKVAETCRNEQLACYHFWRQIGVCMGIKDIPPSDEPSRPGPPNTRRRSFVLLRATAR